MKVPGCILVALFVAMACGGNASAPSATPGDIPAAAVPTPTASVPVASVAPTHLPELGECGEGGNCDVPDGTYLTGRNGFFPGLEITVPAGWLFGEQDAGEIALRPSVSPLPLLAISKDVRVVTTTRAMGPMNEIVDDVAGTADAFVEWFTHNPDLTVIEQPTAASIAGTTGRVFAVEVSSSAAYGDPGCPPNPRCADFFTDPAHWGPNFLSIGGHEAVRLYVASIPYDGTDHLLAVAWIVPSAAEIPAFVARTQPILDSIRLPAQYIRN
jgi:hypothetical protein